MPNADNAQVSIVILMFAISSTVWWMWCRRWKRFGEIWRQEPPTAATWNPAVVTLTIVIIGLFVYAAIQHFITPLLISKAQDWLLQLRHPSYADAVIVEMFRAVKAGPSITVESVRGGCLERAVLVALLLALLTGFGSRSARDFGITLVNWRQQVSVGLETAHASFLPVMVLMMGTVLLRQPGEKNALLRLMDQDRRLATLAWVVFAAVVLAPLVEELLFRVILLGWLKTKMNSLAAVGISSVAFAFIHGPLDGAALLPLALLLGSLYDRQQRFLSVVVAHGFFNLWNIALTMAGR